MDLIKSNFEFLNQSFPVLSYLGDRGKRSYCENIICSLEDKIIAIKQEKVKGELYKSLILSDTRYGDSGDWSKLPSGYSYQDKQFLNDLFSKIW